MNSGDIARVTSCPVHMKPLRNCVTCQFRGALVMIKAMKLSGFCRIVLLCGPVPDHDISYISPDALTLLSPLEQLAWEAE